VASPRQKIGSEFSPDIGGNVTIPSAVGPHSCGAGVVQGVKVERATVRTTLTPWAAAARLAPGRWQVGWELPHPPHDERAVAGRTWSISEPERPRRRHRLDPGCAGSPHAADLPIAGARGVGRAERGGGRCDGAAGPTRPAERQRRPGALKTWRKFGPLGASQLQGVAEFEVVAGEVELF
jgi:hypothetical protein